MTKLKYLKDFVFKNLFSVLPKVEACIEDDNKSLDLTAEEYQVWQAFLEALGNRIEVDPERTLNNDDINFDS